MFYSASAPATMMLMGEHAVLHDAHALVCAVDKRMQVVLTPRHDHEIHISSQLGNYTTILTSINIERPFQFVLGTIKRFQSHLKTGCDIQVTSTFSDTIGFGSSAAVTVAMLATLTMWLGLSLSPQELIREARSIVQDVQGLGSGADVAACVLGGLVLYKMDPLHAEALPYPSALTALYSGYKTPTVDVVNKVNQRHQSHGDILNPLFDTMNAGVLRAAEACRQQNWAEVGALMNFQQGLMIALGVSTPFLQSLVDQLQQDPEILGAKISGSGLGDCIIGLGKAARLNFENAAIQQFPITIAAKGVVCEKN